MSNRLNRVFRTTTPIRYPGISDYATGFFFRTNRRQYLITCRHAIYEPDKSNVPFLNDHTSEKFKPDEIIIKVRDENDQLSTRTKSISLYDNDGSPIWIEPDYYPADIVAIPLDISIMDSGNTSFGVPMGAVGAKRNIDPGDSAIVAGYSIPKTPNYTPILRDALISSPLNLDLEDQPHFLIDAKLHDGTSGSPVLIRTDNRRGKSVLALIGVHAGRYNLIEKGSENLNRVWFISHIEEKLYELEPGLLEVW